MASMSSAGVVSDRLQFTERGVRTSRYRLRLLSELETSIRHTSTSDPDRVRHLESINALNL